MPYDVRRGLGITNTSVAASTVSAHARRCGKCSPVPPPPFRNGWTECIVPELVAITHSTPTPVRATHASPPVLTPASRVILLF